MQPVPVSDTHTDSLTVSSCPSSAPPYRCLSAHPFLTYVSSAAWTCTTPPVERAVCAIIPAANNNARYFLFSYFSFPLFHNFIFIDLITDRFSVNGTRVTRRRGLIVKKFDISEIESTRLKKGLFGEKIEFYVKGKCIAKVSTNNQPYDLLDKRIRKEHILRKR